MPGKRMLLVMTAICVLRSLAAGDLVTARIGPETKAPGKLVITGSGDKPTWTIEADLSGLPRDTRIYRAYLCAARTERPTGRDDWALTDILIRPWLTVTADTPSPLKLVGPWYDRFDATQVVRDVLKSPGTCKGFSVEAFPNLDAGSVRLDIEYEGKLADPPKQPGGLRVFHRAGQTFITFSEIEKLLPDEPVTWRQVRTALENLDEKRVVRYRIYRHAEPITAKNIASAECLAEVKPLSSYNVNGRSADQAFMVMRRKMLEDMDYAKGVSKNWYSIPASAWEEVLIDRFVIDPSGQALPNGTGLYVHSPSLPAAGGQASEAGKAYYAVATCIDGLTNTVDFSAENATAKPIEETVGASEPVFQREMDMKVLFDYAGRRLQYVQWTAPPLSNLPNQYYNWSVFIPDGVGPPAPLELFLSGNDMFRRPRWPHRLDTVLLAPQDESAPNPATGRSGELAPFRTWYFGCHESAGTLKSFNQGLIHPYTWRRMLAFLNWAVQNLPLVRSQTPPAIDKARITCSGDRGYAATAALHFGVRNPEVFSLIYTCKGMPNPAALPGETKPAGRRPAKTPVFELEGLIGKKEWALKIDAGDGKGPAERQNVWDFLNLTEEVARSRTRLRPMLSYGGRGGGDWAPISEFLKAQAEARQPVISEGTWGAVDPPGLKNPGAGRPGLDVRGDRPIPVFTRCTGDYQGGRNGDGGATNYGVWWDYDGIVDEAGKFEIVLTGNAAVDVTPRRTKNFTLRPGETVQYATELLGERIRREDKPQSGQATADQNGLVTIPQVNILGKARLIITRSAS